MRHFFFFSAIFPNQESDMISIKQNACFALISKIRSEIHSADNMPASFEFLLKSLFNILSCIFQIRYLTSDHLNINIFSDEHGVLFVLHFHVTEFYLGRDWNIWWYPVFWNTCTSNFLLFLFLNLLILCYCCHFVYEFKLIY